MIPNPDAALAAVERAQSAPAVVHELLDQADAVLDRLVGAHYSGKLSDRDAAVGIATIAELRRAAGKGQRAIMRGTAAAESLTTGAKP